MRVPRRLACLATLMTAVMLSACGFQLRGANHSAGLPFQTIFLGFAESSSLGNELKRNIRGSGATAITTDAKSAQVILEVLSEAKEKVILSRNSQGRVREYTLYYKLRFRLKDKQNNELLAPTEIVLKRDITFNEAQVLAKEREEELLYRDMQADLVQQIMRRLSAVKLITTG